MGNVNKSGHITLKLLTALIYVGYPHYFWRVIKQAPQNKGKNQLKGNEGQMVLSCCHPEKENI